MIKSISKKLGFTADETKVVLFILIMFLVGFIYKAFKPAESTGIYKEYDYTIEDSLFNAAAGSVAKDELYNDLNDKKVDYKQEVLDFNARNFERSEPKKLPAENSINLNYAGLTDLQTLPGVGEKTAEKILELKAKLGRFTKVEDLLEVKGIGPSKLEKLKKYIFIE